ncbi:MAG: ArsR family transcriptional regulator [Bacteroidales bacterium]|nr:ArsR family transcriptional regulator [Bacteroidales bacterium]MCF8387738.1 ArsR family transcriptional regulator [Bacteroidales bacterium]MCF8397554.1 ArsR family transcriptional regulator [Bacteroidales bacterium]
MLDTLITSKTRLKILLRFFLNSNNSSYMRSLANEFHESTNSIRLELNRFEDAGLLSAYNEGNKKMFKANIKHPLYPDIKNILMKHIGLDKIVENVVKKLGDVKKVFVSGDFARGIDSSIIDLIFVGKINQAYLIKLIEKVENMINRRIRYMVFDKNEFIEYTREHKEDKLLLLWEE